MSYPKLNCVDQYVSSRITNTTYKCRWLKQICYRNTHEKYICGQCDNNLDLMWLAYGWCATVRSKMRKQSKNMSVNLNYFLFFYFSFICSDNCPYILLFLTNFIVDYFHTGIFIVHIESVVFICCIVLCQFIFFLLWCCCS